MAGIQPVTGIRGAMPTHQITQATKADKTSGPSFTNVLKAYVNTVDDKQKLAASAIQDLVSGKTNDVLPVVNAMAKADLSFKMLMGVRNKMIEAYKETMRMQV